MLTTSSECVSKHGWIKLINCQNQSFSFRKFLIERSINTITLTFQEICHYRQEDDCSVTAWDCLFPAVVITWSSTTTGGHQRGNNAGGYKWGKKFNHHTRTHANTHRIWLTHVSLELHCQANQAVWLEYVVVHVVQMAQQGWVEWWWWWRSDVKLLFKVRVGRMEIFRHKTNMT